MFDVIIIGAGISGATFALKISTHAKILLIEAKNEIPKKTNIFAEHDRPFLKEINWGDKTIFPSLFLKANYMGDKENGIINSKEFGEPLGNMGYTEKIIKNMLQKFENNGGVLNFGEKIIKIQKHGDYLEIINNKGKSYSTRLLVLATGSNGFDLQQSLGFETPTKYKGVYTHLYGDEDKINENLESEYMFHLNPKISKYGPFFINKGKDRIFVGFLGDNSENRVELKSKLERILSNYKRIQPFVQGLKKGNDLTIGDISKHPIKKLSKDRVVILGEAAGLVTSLFYEGILGGITSADTAAKTIIPLLESNSNFNQVDLKGYDRSIQRLLKNYFRNGEASEYLFYSDSSYVRSLWNIYVNLLNTNKTVCKYIWEAHVNHDLANHDLSKDRYVGERLFGKLPALSKITLGTKFFRAMLK